MVSDAPRTGFDPTPHQLLAIKATLGGCVIDDAALVSLIGGAFAFEDAGRRYAKLPTLPEIAAAQAEADAAFAAVRKAAAHPGNGLSPARLAAIEDKLAEVEALLDRERFKADTMGGIRTLFGRRPGGRGKKLAVGGLAAAFKIATRKEPTISTDPVTREMSGQFVDFARMCCAIAGITITDGQLDKGLREHKERVACRSTARSTSKKNASSGLSVRRNVSNQSVT